MEIGEAHALVVQAVDVRRQDHGIAEARDVAIALVVGQDEDDVGAGWRCAVNSGAEASAANNSRRVMVGICRRLYVSPVCQVNEKLRIERLPWWKPA